jgi:hypothetical protein
MCILHVCTHNGTLIVQGVGVIPNKAESTDNASSFCDVCMDQSWTTDSVKISLMEQTNAVTVDLWEFKEWS